MQVDLASSVSRKFRSKHAFLKCASKLFDKGVRAKDIEDHPVLRSGLAQCQQHFTSRSWYGFRGSLEDYIRSNLAALLAEERLGVSTSDDGVSGLAKLFDITEEEVREGIREYREHFPENTVTA